MFYIYLYIINCKFNFPKKDNFCSFLAVIQFYYEINIEIKQ